jgi:hypothetical protein
MTGRGGGEAEAALAWDRLRALHGLEGAYYASPAAPAPASSAARGPAGRAAAACAASPESRSRIGSWAYEGKEAGRSNDGRQKQ